MANEYFVNRADLTMIAEAIRTKGGTSESLTFPSGFVSAIEALNANRELYIYREGDENSAVTGGLTNSGYTYGGTAFALAEKNDGNLYFPPVTQMSCAGTDNPIDLNGYSKLHIDCTATDISGLLVRVATTREVGGSSSSILAEVAGTNGNKTRTEMILDVSAIKQSCYIVAIGGGSRCGYVYNIWLT